MDNDERNRDIIFILSSGATFIFLYYLTLPEEQQNIEKFSSSLNMFIFASSLLLFCILCLLLNLINIFIGKKFPDSKISKIINMNIARERIPVFFFTAWLILLLVFYLLLFILIRNERNIVGNPSGRSLWHSESLFSCIFLTAVAFSFFFRFSRQSFSCKNSLPNDRLALFFIQGSIIFLYLHASFSSNYLFNGAAAHHGNAYFNSVYNVLHRVPYTDVSNSIYGCYALFLAPILKVCGPTMTNFGIIMAGIGGVYILCIAYVINSLIKKNSLQILGLLASGMSVIGFRVDPYYQTQPHRVIFPGIILAYAVFTLKKGKNRIRYQIGGFVISALAILWNKETGIICVIAWGFLQIYWKLKQSSKKSIYYWSGIFTSLIGVMLSIVSAFFMAGLYNFLVSGSWIETDVFWFPLFKKEYMIDTLQIPINNAFNIDIIVYLLFLYPVAKIIYTIFNVSLQQDVIEDCILFFCAMLGIGLIVYYVNRPAYFNLDITHAFFIILICIYIEKNMAKWEKQKGRYNFLRVFHGIAAYTGIFLIIAFSCMSLLHFQANDRSRAVYRTGSQLNELALEIQDQIPQNTIAYGNGIAEIYTILGWNSNLYIMDASDLSVSPAAKEYLKEYINQLNEPILIGENTSLPILEDASFTDFLKFFQVEKKISYNDIDYLYFVPVEHASVNDYE